MIVEERISRVAKSGFDNDIKFTMEPNAQAFAILIKNIYTDPKRAIIRELGTNAYESHIAAGNPEKPFKVILPTPSAPEFVIRDFGTGLTPEQIRGLYSVFFKSDKRDSNDYNGCFGIGSKCPFAYSQNFTIESFKDGFKYIYNAYMDERGIPHLAELTEEGIPTDEVNGLLIKIPVANRDIYEFSNLAKQVYQYFRVIPDINVTVERPAYELEGKTGLWKLRADGYGQMRVIMGDVAYNMTIGDKLNNKYSSLIHHPIDIFCNIGDISIDSGRERVYADKKTIDFLNKTLAEVIADCETFIQEELEDAETEWELRYRAKRIKGTFLAQFANTIKWKGQAFTIYTLNYSLYLPEDINGKYQIYNFALDGSKSKGYNSVSPEEKCVIVRLDKCTGPHKRCSHYASTNKCYVVGIKCEDDTHWAAIKESLKCPADLFKLASDLDRGPVTKVDYHKYKSVVVYKPLYYHGNQSDYWERLEKDELDIEDAGYYVLVDRGAVIFNGSRIHPSILKQALDQYKSVFGVDIRVYGVIKSLEEDFTENGWTNVYEKLAKDFEDKYKTAKADIQQYYSNNVRGHIALSNHIPIIQSLVGKLKNRVDFQDVLDDVQEYERIQPAYKLEQSYRTIFNRQLVAGEPDKQEKDKLDALIKKLDAIRDKYPLLSFVYDGYGKNGYKEAVAEYVNGR